VSAVSPGLRASRLLPGVLALCLVACASTAPRVRVDKADADLSKCQTFDWLPASKEATSLTEQRVRDAAVKELQAKGYTQSTDKPDCRFTYVLSTSEVPQSKPRVGVGAAGGSGGVSGGVGISLPIGKRPQTRGTFTMDVVDVASNSQIWAGSIDAEFEGNELSEKEAEAVVRKVLAEFPDRATPNGGSG
jgi:hypothetical protein